MGDIGNFCLLLALVCAVWSVLTSWLGRQNTLSDLVRSGERAAQAAGILITIGTLVLIKSFLDDDFSLLYVAHNSTRSQPAIYKVAALWGGQAGSLLLWACILSGYAFFVVTQNRRRNRDLMPGVTATLMSILTFFLVLLSFVANPFEPNNGPKIEGTGLNPLLQNPLMVSHPPTLYLGYVGVAVPFAFAIAALMSGRLGNEWIVTIRRWSLFAWFCLGIGILQGGYWAYVELGWGGYWAWDPVENASLMPWLAMSAFIHSVMIQEKKGMLKVWNMVLVLIAFCLSIFGTFITSGVIAWRRASAKNLRVNFTRPILAGAATSFTLFAFGMRQPFALAAFGLCVFVMGTIVIEFYRGARARQTVSKESLAVGLSTLVGRNKRRYGGYIVHVGMVLVFAGVAGSAGF